MLFTIVPGTCFCLNLIDTCLCRTGGLTAENDSTRGVAGTLSLYGGVIQYQRGPVGTFSGRGGSVTISSGFKKDYRYDDRFNLGIFIEVMA
jgi:hypothetical protein